jgi:transposase InsO family protein
VDLYFKRRVVGGNFESYIYIYNYKRLHSSLGYITPVQKMAELNKSA